MGASTTPLVLFNASVILAGLNSPTGGSGKLLIWLREGKINGIISQIIFDEVIRNAARINLSDGKVAEEVKAIFSQTLSEPEEKNVNQMKKVVLNLGDAHVLASAKEEKADFLVTLDKKHLLVLKGIIKIFKIVTPGELIQNLRINSFNLT